MNKKFTHEDNFVYFVDDTFKIISYNDALADAYPDLKCGSFCYEVFMDERTPCVHCPIVQKCVEEVPIYHSALNQWLHVKAGQIDWMDKGQVTVLMASRSNSIDSSFWQKLPNMGGYDVLFLLNLTKNSYQKMLAGKKNEIFSGEESIEELISRTARDLIHPDDRERFCEFWDVTTLMQRVHEAGDILHAEFREKKQEGAWDLVRIVLMPEQNKEEEILAALFMVIHPRHVGVLSMNEQPDYIEGVDPLTGLLCGNELRSRVNEYVQSRTERCCMLVMDIEHFRFFNKWYGRAAGDRLLKKIGDFLTEFDKNCGSISGYCGGDNFCIVFEYQKKLVELLNLSVSEIVGEFEGITGFQLLTGGYMIPDSGCVYRDMYDNATTAMRRMRGRYQKEVSWYGEELVSDLENELRMLPEIKRGIEEKEFVFYLQMKYSLVTEKIVGAEALLRWNHKKRGVIMPGSFIPLCEKNGMITKLDQYLWEEVCKRIRSWLDLGYQPVPISVNVSRLDFYEIDVPEYFEKLIEKYKIDPRYIEIEITESAFVENAAILQRAEEKFHEKGFRVLIDDFGSGYSSLNMLKDIQAEVLKMDVRFLDMNERNKNKGREIVKSVFDMANALKYTVVAEGVETKEQLNTLESIGCEYVQGFYFYRPMPVEEYEEKILKKNEKSDPDL